MFNNKENKCKEKNVPNMVSGRICQQKNTFTRFRTLSSWH